ncbi:MAG TPA: type II secretion system protein GspM [Albitalea sp.]|uniref:type II secretion system protein GspM n=1 Tax=Piscinibacter sp. TaxID=1903157 RepID=UPI002ED569B3
MNARSVTLPPALASLRTQARTRWRSFAPRERLALAVGGGLLAVFIAWSLLVAPAWRVSREAPSELDRLDAQLQQMQRLAADAKTLKGAPPVSPAQAMAPLKSATERLGDKASLVFQGDRATLTLTGVSGDALRDWLGEARSAARARATDVQLNRSPEGYSGTVVVSLGTGS